MDDIIHKLHNNSTLKLTEKDNIYYIFFISNESRYYCINDCGRRRCYCKDKDWSQGLWDGELYYSSNYQKILNIFYFLKDNFEILSNLNRKELGKWIRQNVNDFINKFYEEKLILTKIYTLYLFYVGFFGKELYRTIKNEFIKKNSDLLHMKIDSEYIHDNSKYIICKKTIQIGNITLFGDFKYSYDHNSKNKIKSLFELIIKQYENRFEIYKFILNTKKFLLNNINIKKINSINDIDVNLIKECNNKQCNYFSIDENISDIVREITNKKNLDLFYEKYVIDENIKKILQKNDINNINDIYIIYHEINGIIESWLSLNDNLEY